MAVNLLDQPTPVVPQWLTLKTIKPGYYPECYRCHMRLSAGDRVCPWYGLAVCERCHAWEHAAEAPPALAVYDDMGTARDRDTAIKALRRALKTRSGKDWSVTGGRGTAHGWITISAPPSRRHVPWAGSNGYLTPQDAAELGKLLGLERPVHPQGQSIAASFAYYREYIDRAAGRSPTEYGQRYWD